MSIFSIFAWCLVRNNRTDHSVVSTNSYFAMPCLVSSKRWISFSLRTLRRITLACLVASPRRSTSLHLNALFYIAPCHRYRNCSNIISRRHDTQGQGEATIRVLMTSTKCTGSAVADWPLSLPYSCMMWWTVEKFRFLVSTKQNTSYYNMRTGAVSKGYVMEDRAENSRDAGGIGVGKEHLPWVGCFQMRCMKAQTRGIW